MKKLLAICIIAFLGCSDPAASQKHAGTSNSLQEPQQDLQWPNDPVTFYQGQPSVIDFTTYKPVGVDVTSTYRKLYEGGLDLPADLQELRKYKVILVEGIMSNYVDFVGKLIMNRFNEYEIFYDYMDWLEHVGIEFEELKTDTEDSVSINAVLVEKAIEKSPKPVVIVAHSKGGVEAIMALVQNPSLHSKVKGALFLQSPFYGTPTADYLSDIPVWDFLANFVLMVLGGSGEAMHNLTSYERVPWMRQWEQKIEELVKKVPVLSFSTWKDDEPERRDSMFEFSRNKVKVDGKVDNDGLVPYNSMVLPDGRYVMFEGNDHASTVTDNKYIKFDRMRFLRAMLRTLYAK